MDERHYLLKEEEISMAKFLLAHCGIAEPDEAQIGEIVADIQKLAAHRLTGCYFLSYLRDAAENFEGCAEKE